MSYMNLNLVADPEQPRGGANAWNALEEVERRVVRLSLEDGRASLSSRGGPLSRLRAIMGERPSKTLANPRLEALRRYAVLYRLNGGLVDTDDESAVIGAGYTEPQIRSAEQFLHILQPDLATRHKHPGRTVMILVLCLFALAGCAWLGAVVEDPAIAAIIFGALVVSILSAFSGTAQ